MDLLDTKTLLPTGGLEPQTADPPLFPSKSSLDSTPITPLSTEAESSTLTLFPTKLPLVGSDSGDTLHGTFANDWISGGSGDDLIYGWDGNDGLNGNEGDDTINGGAGDDIINGGAGHNVLVGGEGSDRFVVDTPGGYDTILDFGAGDQVDLSGLSSPDASGVSLQLISLGTDTLIQAWNGSVFEPRVTLANTDPATLVVSGSTVAYLGTVPPAI